MSLRVKVLVTLAVLAVGVGYILHRFAASPEWQQFQSRQLWQIFLQVRLSWLLLGAAMIFLSYFFRSLRWQEFLRPLKLVSLGNIFVSTLIGFSAVSLLGRPGEVVRPLLIARKEGLPVSSQFGAWTLERVFDSLTMAGMLGAALLFLPSRHDNTEMISHLRHAGILIFLGAVLAAVSVLQFRHRQQTVQRFLYRLSWPLPRRFRDFLQRMLEHFSTGLGSLEKLSSFLLCAIFSVLVWAPVLLAYWSVTRAFGEAMSHLHLGAIVLVLAASIAGSVAHVPGVGGGTQVASVLALTELFGVPLALATSAAILFWVLAFMIVLIPGLPLAAREGLNWQRLRNLAREKL